MGQHHDRLNVFRLYCRTTKFPSNMNLTNSWSILLHANLKKMIKQYLWYIISNIRMQDLILKTSNMYDSAQTNIINIFASKRGGGRDLFMHIERGIETVIDDLCREHTYNVNIHIFHIYDNYKSLAISKRSKQLIIVFWSWQLSLVVTASRVDKPINVLQILINQAWYQHGQLLYKSVL